MAKTNSTDFRHFIAGASSGALTKTITAPLERIKILFQVQDMKNGNGSNPKYGRRIFSCAKIIVREDGFLGFFKGNWANVIRVMPMYSLKFAMNDKFKSLFLAPGQKYLSFSKLVFCGTLAGLVQITCTYPLELVRTRMALSSSWGADERGVFKSMVNIFRSEGIMSFYKGFGICIATGTPCVALQLAIFQHLRTIFGEKEATHARRVAKELALGGVAGLTSQTLTYWGDTMKRRMQSDGVNGSPRVYKNAFDCAFKIAAREGFKGFYRGYFANALRSIPGAAIQLTAYAQLKSILIKKK